MSRKSQAFAQAEANLAGYLNKIGNEASKRASAKINDPAKLSYICNAHKTYVAMGLGLKLSNRLTKDKKLGYELYFSEVEIKNFHADFLTFLKEVRETGDKVHNSNGEKVGNWIKSLSAASAISEEEASTIIDDGPSEPAKSSFTMVLPASPESSLKIVPNKDKEVKEDQNQGNQPQRPANPNWTCSDDELEADANAQPKRASKKSSMEEQKLRNNQEEDLLERLYNSVAGNLAGVPLGVRKNVLKRFAGFMGVEFMNHEKTNGPQQKKEQTSSNKTSSEASKKKVLSQNGKIEHALRAMQEEAKKLNLKQLPQDHPLTKEWMRLREERKSFRDQSQGVANRGNNASKGGDDDDESNG